MVFSLGEVGEGSGQCPPLTRTFCGPRSDTDSARRLMSSTLFTGPGSRPAPVRIRVASGMLGVRR